MPGRRTQTIDFRDAVKAGVTWSAARSGLRPLPFQPTHESCKQDAVRRATDDVFATPLKLRSRSQRVKAATRALQQRTQRVYAHLLKELPGSALRVQDEQERGGSACADALEMMKYGPEWREQVSLLDGTTVTLRCLMPDDAERLVDGFQKLSPESRYQRFMSPMQTLPQEYVTYLTDIDHVKHFAVAALIDDPARLDEVGVGVGRFVTLDDPQDEAELAITVIDDAQHSGLGSVLMAVLVLAGRERGLKALRAEVLPNNDGMQRLAARFGGERIATADGLHTWRVPLTDEAIDRVFAERRLQRKA